MGNAPRNQGRNANRRSPFDRIAGDRMDMAHRIRNLVFGYQYDVIQKRSAMFMSAKSSHSGPM